ncbi:hypothetical protein JAAARDRAFT_75549 [Jaapia argillacea MUCL 33604]|uniref:C2H2-type domain-containing protein n=1 Tax=Jaapia argillacea MUCL 33604 TaxID=933084 RepID=A0A067QHH4_9AGAM|nr:hypothetical protein JAAARDRAFT_75549 [Jaapia argillacea MUCL 33604]
MDVGTSLRRPMTRSQTSSKLAPLPPDEETQVQPSSPMAEVPSSAPTQYPESAHPSVSDNLSSSSQLSPSLHSKHRLTFVDPSSSSSLATKPEGGERRGPRTRAAPPVPVPNLTKRSRGRRVPTDVAVVVEKEGDDKSRMYVCKVKDCGKCFHRGEHLKRHIRSIHTHEKPYKCSYPSCEKYFSRHDNLLQHQKIHRDYSFPETAENLYGPLQRVHQQTPHHFEDRASAAPSMSVIVPHAFTNVSVYHGPTTEPMGFSTNIAVSSLRTELPPPTPQPPPPPSQQPPSHSQMQSDIDISTAAPYQHFPLPPHFSMHSNNHFGGGTNGSTPIYGYQ